MLYCCIVVLLVLLVLLVLWYCIVYEIVKTIFLFSTHFVIQYNRIQYNMTSSNTNATNINVEKNIFGGLTTQDLTHNKVSRMIFVRHHLEDGWKVKRNGDHFIMKNDNGHYLAVTDECVIKMNYRDYIEEHGDILNYKEICHYEIHFKRTK